MRLDPSSYTAASPLVGVLILVAIAAAIVVSIATHNLLLGGIVLVALVALDILMAVLLSRRRKRQYDRYVETIVQGQRDR